MIQELEYKNNQENVDVKNAISEIKESIASTSLDFEDTLEKIEDKQKLLSRELKSYLSDELKVSAAERNLLKDEMKEKLIDIGSEMDSLLDNLNSNSKDLNEKISGLNSQFTIGLQDAANTSRETIQRVDEKLESSINHALFLS